MRWARPAAAAAMTAALVQCAPAPDTASSPPQPAPSQPSQPAPSRPPQPSPTEAPAETRTDLAPETVRTVPPPPRPAEVHPVTAADLGTTWRPGCPLAPDTLRLVELDYRGMNGQTHRGQLVVHQDLTDEVIVVFAQLLEQRFPIEKMQTVDHYLGADDELSMRDNNTSAFNCRDIPGTGSWSLHAYGRAIDINPKLNPYIGSDGNHEPANSGPWVDRSRTDPGMLHDGDAAVGAFTDRGWRWGGHWRTPLDYQHFELR